MPARDLASGCCETAPSILLLVDSQIPARWILFGSSLSFEVRVPPDSAFPFSKGFVFFTYNDSPPVRRGQKALFEFSRFAWTRPLALSPLSSRFRCFFFVVSPPLYFFFFSFFFFFLSKPRPGVCFFLVYAIPESSLTAPVMRHFGGSPRFLDWIRDPLGEISSGFWVPLFFPSGDSPAFLYCRFSVPGFATVP